MTLPKLTLEEEFQVGISRHRVPLSEMLKFAPAVSSALNADVLSGASAITVKNKPGWAVDGACWLAVGVGDENCEVRKVTSFSGINPQLDAVLSNNHSDGDAIIWLDRPIVNVRWFGAQGDGSTDDGGALVAAALVAAGMLDDTSKSGAGVWYIPAGNYITSQTITLYEFVKYSGDQAGGSKIKLADGANVPVFKSYDFDNLTGTGIRGEANGVPCAFEIRDLVISGNKYNNTSGGGIVIYGHHYWIDNVRIYNTADTSLYSEYGAGTGSQSSWYDMPEAQLTRLSIWGSGGFGIQWRGPHDSFLDNLIINGSTDHGLSLEYDYTSGNYGGTCDIGFAHIYSTGDNTNQNYGLYADIHFRASMLTLETSAGYNLHITNHCDKVQIGTLTCYNAGHNVTSPTKENILIEGTNTLIGNLRISDVYGVGGVNISGNGTTVGSLHIDGKNMSGVGVYLQADACTISGGEIHDYDASGGYGLQTAQSSAIARNKITLNIKNCDTCWDHGSQSKHNRWNITMQINNGVTGQVGWTGQKSDTDHTEDWMVTLYDGDTGKHYTTRWANRYTTTTVDLTSTSLQTISVPYGDYLLYDPRQDNVSFVLECSTTGAWALDYMTLKQIDTTNKNIDVNVKVGSAVGSGAARVMVKVDL